MPTKPPKLSGFGKRHEIQRLLPRHHKIVDLALAGHNNAVIAEIVELRTRSICMILQSPVVQAELKRRREGSSEAKLMDLDRDAYIGRARSIMEQESELAAATVVELMDSKNESMQLRSAKEILDRALGKVNEPGNKGPTVNVMLSVEQTDLLVLAMKETNHAQDNEQSADGQTDNPTQDGHGDVQETTEASSEG